MFSKPNRKVTRCFIHCSAHDGTGPEYRGKALMLTVDRWHRDRGFDGIGYHYIIDKKGVIIEGRGLEKSPAAQQGHNGGTIAICVHGLTNFSLESLKSLRTLCAEINHAYDGNITFHGHREVANKACPVFDYKSLLNLDDKGNMVTPLFVNNIDKDTNNDYTKISSIRTKILTFLRGIFR